MNSSLAFADRLHMAIERSRSVLVAGLDPNLDDLPRGLIAPPESPLEERVAKTLTQYVDTVLPLLQSRVAAIKPNIAFFEQYGIGGLIAFQHLMKRARELGILTIADAKRGDIGSTAQAYSSAFLGKSKIFGEPQAIFDADALTVNPFLGFDTIEEFLKDCARFNKGLFVLVKTSNPGSAAIQGLSVSSGPAQGAASHSVSSVVAEWMASQAERLIGKCNLSGLGAVVGATYPEEARALRARMPKNYFLIPGLGAQGGSAQDALAGFCPGSPPQGGIVNVSRGIFSIPEARDLALPSFEKEIVSRIDRFNRELNNARGVA